MEAAYCEKSAEWPLPESHAEIPEVAKDRYRLQSRRKKKTQRTQLLDFKLHFTVPGGNNVFELLETAEKEVSSQRYIHSWDDRAVSDPIRNLLSSAKHELRVHSSTSGQYILNFSSVDRVCTINGINYRRHVAGRSDREIQDQLLPTRVSDLSLFLPVLTTVFQDGEWAAQQTNPPSASGATPQISSGRVMYVKTLLFV